MKTRQYALATLLALSASGATLSSHADNLNMPEGGEVQTISMPKRGMNMEQVQAVFGAPESKHGPKGTPPIYYWEYPSYTVYFESDFVIHTVSKYRQAKSH